jgi:hypothetical protein
MSKKERQYFLGSFRGECVYTRNPEVVRLVDYLRKENEQLIKERTASEIRMIEQRDNIIVKIIRELKK